METNDLGFVDELTIPVLDTGFVRLVKWTGSDLDISRAARVSYNEAWRAGKDEKSDTKLISYLLKNGHTSPFEHVVFTFDVLAPIFVLRQWHRHRTWSYSELSGRYRELNLGFYVPNSQDLGGPNAANKQGKDLTNVQFNPVAVQSIMRDHMSVCRKTYEQLREMGVANELARIVLPVATYSQMFATVDLHNLFNFVRLRSHPHAQMEIQVYSNALLQLAQHVVPVAVQAFVNMNWPEGNGPDFDQPEA